MLLKRSAKHHVMSRNLPIQPVGSQRVLTGYMPATYGRLALGCLALTLSAGCPGFSPPSTGDGGFAGGCTTSPFAEDGNCDPSLSSPLGKTAGEPNDTFAQSVVAVFDAAGVARLRGSVSRRGDMDVFRLGAIRAGDRITVDARTPGSALDVAVGIFDGEQRLVFNNDDRTNSNLDAYLEFVARHDGDPYYLVVTHSGFARSGEFTGGYVVEATISNGHAVPPPAQQILVLNFEGGVVDIPGVSRGTISPFDAGRIDAVYANQTQVLKELIRDVVVENFERFNVIIRTSDDPALPAGTEFSTVFFGGFNAGAFGIAEQVDLYNVDRCDDAIIFTESFGLGVFSFTPTTAEMAVAIGNVAAHEAGHVLGLNHVDNDLDLMDDRSPADAFIENQEFMESPLSSDIMPIGTQDGVLLLNQSVGPALPTRRRP